MTNITNPIIRRPKFSYEAITVLRNGNILSQDESTDSMIDRVIKSVFDVENQFDTCPRKIVEMKIEFADYLADKLVILGSPTLTNAGRNKNSALSSCVAIPVDLNQPFEFIKPIIEDYYKQNMGSGFNFSKLNDPAQMVRLLNKHAIEETSAKKYDRYIGNMGNLDIDHPKVNEFITLKSKEKGIRHFNLSVNVTKDFMDSVLEGKPYTLKGGKQVDAGDIWESVVNSAWKSGDPGILFLERFNEDNPTPLLGNFTTTAPCAEVGLAPGESCVFGYINVGQFFNKKKQNNFDFSLLEKVVPLTTRVLDNCLEVSLNKYPTEASKIVMGGKRKIGIGICGFADLLVKMNIPYGSDNAIQVLQNILTTISYFSKLESYQLAKKRGTFSGFRTSKYQVEPNFLTRKYGKNLNSRISVKQWKELERSICKESCLRNATTTSLPPTGRSALIVDASTSIEPHFSLKTFSGKIRDCVIYNINSQIGDKEEASRILSILEEKGTCKGLKLPNRVSKTLRKATEISPEEHLQMLAATINCVDEGASKTVNLPKDAKPKDVSEVFIKAWNYGLKAISIYRDGSHLSQPENL